MLTLFDALSRIDTAATKAKVIAESIVDYFSDEPFDPARLLYDHEHIGILADMMLDYLTTIGQQYAEAKRYMDSQRTSAQQQPTASAQTEPDNTTAEASTNAAQRQATADTDQAERTQHDTDTSTAPSTEAQALERIRHIDLNAVTNETDTLYHDAIRRYILSDDSPAAMPLDWTILISYSIGIMEGQRRERQRRRAKATAQSNT